MISVNSEPQRASTLLQVLVPADIEPVRDVENVEKPSSHEVDEIIDALRLCSNVELLEVRGTPGQREAKNSCREAEKQKKVIFTSY